MDSACKETVDESDDYSEIFNFVVSFTASKLTSQESVNYPSEKKLQKSIEEIFDIPKIRKIVEYESATQGESSQILLDTSSIPEKNIETTVDETPDLLELLEMIEIDSNTSEKSTEESLVHLPESSELIRNLPKCLILDSGKHPPNSTLRVDDALIRRMNFCHIQGINFMWKTCFGSSEILGKSEGSGCILIHGTDMGKHLQIAALSHTLITHEEMGIKKIIIAGPVLSIINWENEFQTALKLVKNADRILVHCMRRTHNKDRLSKVKAWDKEGGVLIVGYDMLKALLLDEDSNIRRILVEPGPDLIVLDEAQHLINIKKQLLRKAIGEMSSARRIAFTGTPLKNNWLQYYKMSNLVKPNFFKSESEFKKVFIDPIKADKCRIKEKSEETKLHKMRELILRTILGGYVQEMDYSEPTPIISVTKQEYAIYVSLSDLQIRMYRDYLCKWSSKSKSGESSRASFHVLLRICAHPVALKMHDESLEKNKSFKNAKKPKKQKISYEAECNMRDSQSNDLEISGVDGTPKKKWWEDYISEDDSKNVALSSKLLVLFSILEECKEISDKLVVISQHLNTLELIEKFLRQIYEMSEENENDRTEKWMLGIHYFRLDSKITPETKNQWLNEFNNAGNVRARLLLTTTRSGASGMDFTGGNRVIIFDTGFEHSSERQSINSVYRLSQEKPCYIYWLIAFGTAEKRVFDCRHFSSCESGNAQHLKNIHELYPLTLPGDDERPALNFPEDLLLEKVISKHWNSIINIRKKVLPFFNEDEKDSD